MTYTKSYNTELKREYTPNIIKTIIAFANTAGGKIYIGIEDDGTIVGVNDIDSAQLHLINAVNDTIKPDITLFISENAFKVILPNTLYTEINTDLSEAELNVQNYAKQQKNSTAVCYTLTWILINLQLC